MPPNIFSVTCITLQKLKTPIKSWREMLSKEVIFLHKACPHVAIMYRDLLQLSRQKVLEQLSYILISMTTHHAISMSYKHTRKSLTLCDLHTIMRSVHHWRMVPHPARRFFARGIHNFVDRWTPVSTFTTTMSSHYVSYVSLFILYT